MIAGRYRLEREVGRGGMGAVWLARDEVLGRPVAVKRLGLAAPTGQAAADAGLDLARAEREARLAAALNHPHVVAVFDLVVEDDQQWLVMEYVPSLTLAGLVHRDGPLGADRSAALLAQAADALAVAHGAGIVHRDVKPSNLLVTDDDTVKITDFGIARAQADASLTATGLVTGSPAYLAPEVASGRAATPASDVWSLGATLFHAVAGHPPYDVGDNVVGALYRIVHEEPPRLGAEAGWLAPVLEATMATDPDRRWPADRVRAVLAGGPGAVPAVPVTDAAPTTPAATAAPAGATAAAATAPADATPPVIAPTPVEPRRRRTAPVLAVVAAVVAVLLGVGLVSLLGGDDEDPAAGDRSTRPTPSGAASSPPPDQEPGTPASPEEPAATEEELVAFVEDYLDTVTDDPATTWERLTPAFQDASGGFGSYQGFWSTVRDADLRNASADPASMTVQYVVEYRLEDGGRRTDEVALTLEQVDGELKIASEA